VPTLVHACEQVSEGMLDFTYNWICSVRRFNFFNYVILASDHNTYASLQEAGVRSSPPFVLCVCVCVCV
jgi:hypothetical protein